MYSNILKYMDYNSIKNIKNIRDRKFKYITKMLENYIYNRKKVSKSIIYDIILYGNIGQYEIIKNKINLDDKDHIGLPPLFFAIFNLKTEFVKKLLDNGAKKYFYENNKKITIKKFIKKNIKEIMIDDYEN